MDDANNGGMGDSMPSWRVVGARADDAADGTPGAPPDPGPEPPLQRPREHTAWQLRVQARACAVMGSPLYGMLLGRAADDCAAGGVTWEILAPHAAPGRGDALGLRFMAAVHRLVLEGGAPDLEPHYASAGGTAPVDGAWDAFASTLSANVARLARDVERPCQTNEVGRSAALMVGFLEVAARTGLPLRLLEVGASAGLNLRCDHFRIGGDGVTVGDPASPVDLSTHWKVPPPRVGTGITVVARRGCDRAPVDATTPQGRLALTASVWADQRERLDRLRGALELARRHPAPVDAASLDAWTARQLAQRPSEPAATVLYHSVVIEYVADEVRRRFVDALHEAGQRASTDRPLAWVRLEPISALRHHGIALTLWPGGTTETLARCGAHGADVEWLGGA